MTAQIIRGDAFELLGRLSDGSVDHVITDPPYTARSTKARTTRKGGSGAWASGNGRTPSDPMSMGIATAVGAWDAATLARFAAECLRVSRRWVVIFCELESLGTFAAMSGFVRSGIWDRHSTPQITGDRPAQPAEGLAFLSTSLQAQADEDQADYRAWCEERDAAAMALLHREGRKRWNGGGKRGIWRHPVTRGAQRLHPAQKPGGLILDLVNDFTDPGDSVLDPCCGVGTIPVVADGAGRRGVGFDASAVWAARAALRAAGDPGWCAPLSDAERAALDAEAAAR